ncbi:MAG: DUF1549 domain-containing protein, partial [Verrucomicrobiota bacterium]
MKQTDRTFGGLARSIVGARVILLLIASTMLAGAPPPPNAEAREVDVEFFEKRVRPILIERCYECHGEKKQKGGLRLDSAEAVRKGGDTGPALVPGKPDESLLIKAISWNDPEFQMPPKNKLGAAEILTLTEWVKRGAPDPRTTTHSPLASRKVTSQGTQHWAYLPIKKPQPPKPKNSKWPRNDIDRFVLAKLESKKLEPNPDADRASLLRRVFFDLVGLPPSPEQIDAFERDPSADALARVVDVLLGRPEFGERWGRHWLDVARFAESVTLRGLVFREAWRYRDYVIEAFNADRPFDEFIREQIAGDLLPATSLAEKQRRLIATTFLTLGNTNLEEQDKAQLRMDIVDEQLDTMGKAFLAQTIGCARCHDHKFDPIPTRDYYALAGILRNTVTVTNANVSGWIELPLPVEPEEEAVYRKHEAEIAMLQAEIKSLKETMKALAGKSAETRAGRGSLTATVISPDDLPGIVVDSAQAKRVGDWKHSQFSKHYIGDGYLHDDAKGKGAKTLTFIPELKKAGRYEVRLAYLHSPSRATNVPVTIFHAAGETTVQVNQQEAPLLEHRFVSLGQFRFEANGFAYVLVSNENTAGHVTADAVQFLPVEMIELAAIASNPETPSTDSDNASLATRLKQWEEQVKKLNATGPKRPMFMGVREEEEIGDTYIHVRGSVHQRGATVPRGFLQVVTRGPAPVMPEAESGRRELAEWIASSSNPLTARVFVNRVWHWLFGAGLVRTPDNFGTTGETPSHPELLDYLAARFMEQGWSVKQLVREIVLSRTYQLRSETGVPAPSDRFGKRAARLAHLDPENRWLGRANRRRLDAECLR